MLYLPWGAVRRWQTLWTLCLILRRCGFVREHHLSSEVSFLSPVWDGSVWHLNMLNICSCHIFHDRKKPICWIGSILNVVYCFQGEAVGSFVLCLTTATRQKRELFPHRYTSPVGVENWSHGQKYCRIPFSYCYLLSVLHLCVQYVDLRYTLFSSRVPENSRNIVPPPFHIF